MIVKLLEIEEKQTLNSVEKNFQRKEFSAKRIFSEKNFLRQVLI